MRRNNLPVPGTPEPGNAAAHEGDPHDTIRGTRPRKPRVASARRGSIDRGGAVGASVLGDRVGDPVRAQLLQSRPASEPDDSDRGQRSSGLCPAAPGRDAASAAAVAPVNVRGRGLAVPRLAPGVPLAFEVQRTNSNATVQRTYALIAEEMVRQGVLLPSDWSGSIVRTIETGVAGWFRENGLGNLNALDHIHFQFTDDAEFGIGVDGYDFPQSWWYEFGRQDAPRRHRLLTNNREMSHTPPVGLFTFRSGGDSLRLCVKKWALFLKQEFGEGVAGDVLGALTEGLDSIGGTHLRFCLDQIAEYDEAGDYEDGESLAPEELMTVEAFKKHIPPWAYRYGASLERLSAACDRFAEDAQKPKALQRYHPRAVAVAEAARELAEAMHRQDLQNKIGETVGYQRHSHRICHNDQFPHFLFPVCVMWTGDTWDDPCVRVIDDHWEMLHGDTHTDFCWVYGFDIDKEGGEDVPGTVAFAVYALKAITKIVAPLEKLLTLLSAAAPGLRRPGRKPKGTTLLELFRAAEEIAGGKQGESTPCK